MGKEISLLQQYLDASSFTVAITGAGISMSIGIMDMEHLNAFEAMQTISVPMIRAFPERSYKLLRKSFLKAMFETGPSITHKKLAELEKRGKVHGVITNNLDCLHSFAGSHNVAEIQGSYAMNRCMDCGEHYDDVQIWNQGKAPRCQKCNGIVVSFPAYSHIGMNDEGYRKAGRWISQAQLVIAIGSKGMYGGYLKNINRQAKLVQINPNPTQFDSVAALNIRAKADDVFGLLE
jgi:NAD-dependent deacetylase